MIGSLLFYVLYPLSRYLSSVSRGIAEELKKGLSPSVVNGRTLWDDGTVTNIHSQSETVLHDQRGNTMGDATETVEEPEPEDSNTKPDMEKEPLTAGPHNETEKGTAPKMSEMQSAFKGEEASKHKDVNVAIQHKDTEDESIFSPHDISPQQTLTAQFESLQTEYSIQEVTCPVQTPAKTETLEVSALEAEESECTGSTDEKIQTSNSEESQPPAKTTSEVTECWDEHIDVNVAIQHKDTEDESTLSPHDISPQQTLMSQCESLQTEDSIQEVTCPVQTPTKTETLEVSALEAEESECTGSTREQIQISNLDESQPPAKTTFEVTECWDDYIITTGAVTSDASGNSEFIFASFLPNTEAYSKLSEQRDAQTSWHFPAGPGLAHEVQCPLWQLPAGSYYPPMEPTMPFEVIWRVWEELTHSSAAAECVLTPFSPKRATMDFTVMSYNILSQDLLELNKHLYTHCPLEVLDWNYRCSLLLKEIENWTPDILCLQEVQENHYHEQLYPVLSQLGYTCVYKRRTGTKTDGCAICYNTTGFAELAVSKLEFFRPETELLNRHNVGIVLLLQPLVTQGQEVKEMGPPLCVANTHLLFNPRRGDMKLAQLAFMLAEIDTMVTSCKAKGQHCNVVFCGDFNSRPQTPLYQLITTGELYYQDLPAWMISGQEDLSYKPAYHRLSAPLWPSSLGITDSCKYITSPSDSMFESQHPKAGKYQYSHKFMLHLRYCPTACVRPKDLKLIPGVTDIKPDPSRDKQISFRPTISHRLDLESVYKHLLPASGFPEITTLHSEGGATVDYIFYSPKHLFATEHKACGKPAVEGLKLIGCLSLLSEDALWSMSGLPNHIFPSDHLALVAQFQLDLNTA